MTEVPRPPTIHTPIFTIDRKEGRHTYEVIRAGTRVGFIRQVRGEGSNASWVWAWWMTDVLAKRAKAAGDEVFNGRKQQKMNAINEVVKCANRHLQEKP